MEMSDFSQSAYHSPDVLFIGGTSGMVLQLLKAIETHGGVSYQKKKKNKRIAKKNARYRRLP